MPVPWVGRCNECGAVEVHPWKAPGWRRCTKMAAFVGSSRVPVPGQCNGHLHGVKGTERDAIKAAFRIGGVDGVRTMYGLKTLEELAVVLLSDVVDAPK